MAAGIAVGIAVLLAAMISYLVVRGQLRGQVDAELRAQATAIQETGHLDRPFPGLPASAGGPAPYAQVVLAGGRVYGRAGNLQLPVNPHVLAVAAGGAYLTDVRVGASHLREIVFQFPLPFGGQGIATQLARPLNSVDHTLAILRLILVVLCVGGIGLAIILGRLAARRVLAPLADVAATAQHIAETEDLTSRIHVRTDDEVG